MESLVLKITDEDHLFWEIKHRSAETRHGTRQITGREWKNEPLLKNLEGALEGDILVEQSLPARCLTLHWESDAHSSPGGEKLP